MPSPNPQLVECIQAYLTSIGKPHPDLPTSSNPVVPPSQLPTVFEKGCQALNISLSTEKNPWANSKAAETKVEDMPVFKEFLSKISNQGYFDGCPEGSATYKTKYDKALIKFRAKYEKKAEKKAAAAQASSQSKEEAQLQAVEFKNKGNACLNKQAFDEALQFYQQAIDVCADGPASHVFYANAAAALIHLERYEEAAEMCALSIALNGEYSKSHTRLGYAKIQMNDPKGAIASLERALVLSPGNALASKHLATARGMSGGMGGNSSVAPGAAGGAMPDLSSLMGMLGGGGGGGGGGGMGGGMGAMMQQVSCTLLWQSVVVVVVLYRMLCWCELTLFFSGVLFFPVVSQHIKR